MTRSRLLVGGLVVALVAALVAVVVFWRDRDDANERAESSAELVDASVGAEKAAREVVTRMTTYSFRTVEDDFSWVEDAGTENFQKNFEAAGSIAAIKALKAKADGTVVDSAATAASADRVKVLLFVDQKIRAEGTRGFKTDQPRVTLQMVRVDGKWLVDEVQVNNLVSGPGTG